MGTPAPAGIRRGDGRRVPRRTEECAGGTGLLLVELPSNSGSRALAVVISGDGGWAKFDRQIGETFAARGIPAVGLNSLQYFWNARTPEQAAADLARIVRHYFLSWNTSELWLVGYSRGADVLPFMVSRLPADLKARVRIVALLGVGKDGRIRVSPYRPDWRVERHRRASHGPGDRPAARPSDRLHLRVR